MHTSTVLIPFHTHPISPTLSKLTTSPTFLTLSHAADASLSAAPRRLVIRGTFVSNFFPPLLLSVWDRWASFTENEDVRSSSVLWDLTVPTRGEGVKEEDTAVSVKGECYWMAVQARYLPSFSCLEVGVDVFMKVYYRRFCRSRKNFREGSRHICTREE